ncbi:hypothetical protein DFR70_102251 [Nocardia tenerifensis]|uniref:Secreted protein n=1 Tax=Nocardia tenerifensis TaxID=228006 RepID=A0A318KC09_9NOCA|nr:hypothetical protein [Nocardia tenerifensis]PXX68569.1 hypothetical protein DFR70_102251 [Nocardia tenerifensis]
MQDRLRFAVFGGVLVVLFGAALGIGALVGDPAGRTPDDTARPAGADTGLSPTRSGYTLSDPTAPTEPNQAGPLRFRITGPDDTPVVRFRTQHDKKLHLIVVRSDATQYRHAHPTMDAAGTWSIDWSWAQPGTYRVFADFAPEDAEPLVLSRTVTVAGPAAPQPLPTPSRTTTVDGYQVTANGDLSTAGSELRFTVVRDGTPVTDLEPYLGAYAHLVALRANDLAYLHVHPEGEIGRTPPGPEVAFHAQAPSAGAYRLYLDFSHGGAVHTAEFTMQAPMVESSTGPSTSGGAPHQGGGH